MLKKLVATADVLLENFRPDVKTRLGIDYETLSKINPRLVYASISGFGQTGPYATRPGFDQIAQGMGGLMSVTGLPGQGPLRVGIPIADLCGGIFAAYGVTVALLEREQSGQGPVAAHVAAGSDDLHDGFPDLALDDRRRDPGAGGQLPSDQHSHRRLQDEGRPHQHRGLRRQDLGALRRSHGRARVDHRRALEDQGGALGASRLAQRRDREAPRRATPATTGSRSSTTRVLPAGASTT